MKTYYSFPDPPRIIKVNGKETCLLSSYISELGIVISVSGPEQFLLHENNVTELDGSELDLFLGAKDHNGNTVLRNNKG